MSNAIGYRGRLSPAATGHCLLILSAFAFSTAGFFAREAPVNHWAMVFWRNLFGVAALAPMVVASANGTSVRASLRLGRWGWGTVVASAIATICFIAAFAHTSVANVSIIYATAPLLSALIAWLWLRERASRTTICAAALALCGVAVTVAGSLGHGRLGGDALALAMAVAMSLMTVIARRRAGLPVALTACIASLVAALAVLPLGWISGAGFVVSWRQAAWLAAFGVVNMGIALPCYLAGAGLVPAGQAMLISTLEMPLGPLWVWLAFSETPARASLAGGLVVALAVIWQLRALTPPRSRPAAAARVRPPPGAIQCPPSRSGRR